MVSAKGKLRSGLRWREGLGPEGSTQTLYCTQGFRYGRCAGERERFGGVPECLGFLEHPLIVEESLPRCDRDCGEVRVGRVEKNIPVSPHRHGRDFEANRTVAFEPLRPNRLTLWVIDFVPIARQPAKVQLLDLLIGHKSSEHHQVVRSLTWLQIYEVLNCRQGTGRCRVNNEIALQVPPSRGMHSAHT